MKILYVSSEAVPFAKTGGLADVAGALPKALKNMGHDIRVVMPKYKAIDDKVFGLKTILDEIKVHFQLITNYTQIQGTTFPGTDIPVYFVKFDPYFNRQELYAEGGSDYPDNAQRFSLFCMSALWMLRGLDWRPDIIHCNDWQTALIPSYLKHHPDLKMDEFYNRIKVLYTIHNLAFQGQFDESMLKSIGLGWEVYSMDGMEFYRKINLMKAGIVFSDEITTVSETYAKEIQTFEYGCGLDGVLGHRSEHVTGIINGIDYNEWNPQVDNLIPAKYSPEQMAGKAECKKALQKKQNLPAREDVPLIGMISRMTDQKGFDLIVANAAELFKMDIQFVLLGAGDQQYQTIFEKIAKEYPQKVAVNIKKDNQMAHEIEAGADLYLMPSKYEPCGLNQLYSLKYGTVPIVRKTGGLADSITDATPESIGDGTGTGFVFEQYAPDALFKTINRALKFYEDKKVWKKIQLNGMSKDFSWDSSAKKYMALYRKMLGA